MRLKITLRNNHLNLPINYQHILQGLIYSSFDIDNYGKFIHDVGYRLENKKYKLFVFSNLFGDYRISNNIITFFGDVYFYISGYYLELINNVYESFRNKECLSLNGSNLYIRNIEVINLDRFEDDQIIRLRTLSPLVAYTTKDRYVTYYKPSDVEFEELCVSNLIDKNAALNNPIDEIHFEIISVENEKKRLVKFKNNFYVSYLCDMEVVVNYDTLNLIYDTGLSAKGSTGFGMVEII